MDEERTMHKATCSDCGKECEVPFEPTEGKPVRCQDCFKKNRPQKRFGGGGRNFNRGGRNFDRSPREMHKATCSDCGKQCEVPFKPTGDKPVRCRDCFAKHREQ